MFQQDAVFSPIFNEQLNDSNTGNNCISLAQSISLDLSPVEKLRGIMKKQFQESIPKNNKYVTSILKNI